MGGELVVTLDRTANRVLRKLRSLRYRKISWEQIEYFDENWKTRIEKMAAFITSGESVIDLGCGRMWLKAFLRNNTYYPIDYTRRDHSTVVADFNKHEYPDIMADVAFVSGTLEYIDDYEWFVQQVSLHSKKCIVSYCTLECYSDLRCRRRNAWRNHMSRDTLVATFAANLMVLKEESTAVSGNPIFVFVNH